MNFSLPGLLYSSMAVLRSSWAVPPSIRQYSATGVSYVIAAEQGKHTVTAEEAVVLKDVEHTAHLTEDEHTGALLLHRFQKLV